jgi:hypothetical protein
MHTSCILCIKTIIPIYPRIMQCVLERKALLTSVKRHWCNYQAQISRSGSVPSSSDCPVVTLLYNFNQFVSHASQSPLTKRNLASVTGHFTAWRKSRLSHLPKYDNFGYYLVSSDEISPLSQPTSQVDDSDVSGQAQSPEPGPARPSKARPEAGLGSGFQ